MREKDSIRNKAGADLSKAFDVASVTVRHLFEDPAASMERQHQLDLVEMRRSALEKPSYATLYVNTEYQKWLKGQLDAPAWHNPASLFPEIKAGKPVNRYMSDAWKERVIDPDMSEATLRRKRIEYCSGTAQKFIHKATSVAEAFSDKDNQSDVLAMKRAIGELIGTSPESQDATIFKDYRWSTSSYTPDYVDLHVEPSEMDVAYDKVMAGVGLCLGLWVRLADADATRPVSGNTFAPPFQHCSFLSLARDSGWTEHTNIDNFFLEAHLESYSDQEAEKPQMFFDAFREPRFFEDTLAVLRA